MSLGDQTDIHAKLREQGFRLTMAEVWHPGRKGYTYRKHKETILNMALHKQWATVDDDYYAGSITNHLIAVQGSILAI